MTTLPVFGGKKVFSTGEVGAETTERVDAEVREEGESSDLHIARGEVK